METLFNHELLILIDFAIPLGVIMLLNILTAIVTRSITRKHIVKHHLDAMTQKHIDEQDAYIEMLLKERTTNQAELKRLRVAVKSARHCLEPETFEELEAVK